MGQRVSLLGSARLSLLDVTDNVRISRLGDAHAPDPVVPGHRKEIDGCDEWLVGHRARQTHASEQIHFQTVGREENVEWTKTYFPQAVPRAMLSPL